VNEPIISEVRRLVETETFLEGAAEHTDGLAGYVRDFLKKNGGLPNEQARPWTAELCAEKLHIPAPTLRRWMGADQQEPAPVSNQKPAAQKVARSHTKAVLADPIQRVAVLEALPPDVRDELRAELIDLDLPGTATCRHCSTHCP
jgi:hypothetical protein